MQCKKTDSGRKEHGSLSVIIFVFYCSTEQLISDVQLISALSDSGLCSSMLDGKIKRHVFEVQENHSTENTMSD